MFAQLNVYKNLIVGGVIIALLLGLYFYVHSLKVQITDLRSTLKDSYIELANEKLQSARYKAALDAQNKEIEDARFNESLAKSELEKWKALPPKIKYKTITKIREVKSNDCEQIKAVIDDVRHIDFSSL
jgi:hypothetical protein